VIRLAAFLLKVAAALTGVSGIIFGLMGMFAASSMPYLGGVGAFGGVLVLLWTMVVAVPIWGLSDLMIVILSIDENTRMRPQGM
jgi:hypothetical protein